MKMKLGHTLFATSTLIGTAFSLPSNLTSRIQARSLNRQSHPNLPTPGGHEGTQSGFRTANTAAIAYSNNWAGAVREKPPAGGPYTAVSATFTVPAPTAVPGNTGMQAGSAWVGIDGDTYPSAILQTGVDFYIENGQIHNDAWFEWFPDYAYDFNLDVNTGDVIVAMVQSFSPSEGIAVIENQSTGEKATQTVRAPKTEATLAGQNADWIVEDFQSGDSMVALADFGSVTFTGCEAQAQNGEILGLNGATIIELKQKNKVLTEVTVQGDEMMTVKAKL
ncbi:Putative Aspergillopepsin, putaitve (AFU_orthologue; AFUA_7G01200) [Aspergillus calidoustus]|uniref:Putative Aspergillopepsin, putaitve (AFU_orthologue AFUA_7G01200) n=1 Tax=Aspergillus calidoustus TaxID=454130 RepID=A0A0U5CB54_ASPCI|nr:Putative Aspergillopepsin, putaitve (AFU_orthologue; AFUA_7G01200) [Aspergillus calidoustus]